MAILLLYLSGALLEFVRGTEIKTIQYLFDDVFEFATKENQIKQNRFNQDA